MQRASSYTSTRTTSQTSYGSVTSSEALQRPTPSQRPSFKERFSSQALLKWHELSQWQKDNEYLQTGYRQASYSFRRTLKSLRRVHNETVNIWSHIIGAILFSVVPIYMYLEFMPRYKHATTSDVFALAIFFLSVTVLFAFSAGFHTFKSHSPDVAHVTERFDYMGIVLVIWGSTVASDHFGFYCDRNLKQLYVGIATLAAICCGFATTMPVFNTRKGRIVRFAMYSIFGLSAFAGPAHGVKVHGWAAQNQRQSLAYFIGLGIINFTGAAIYTARVPERWCPKKFDIWGASHQILHILVVFGALSHSIGLVKAFDYWYKVREAGHTCW